MNDIDFTFAFTPTLKTREKIQATVYFIVVGRGFGFHLCLFTPKVDIEPAIEEIRQQLFAEADAIANRWGLQFPSADAALDLSSYQSFTHQLSTIASPGFKIRQVVVREIVPLTERIPITPVQQPKPRRVDAIFDSFRHALPDFKEARKIMADIQETEPELYNDPFLGGITTTGVNRNGTVGPQKGKLRVMFEAIVSYILDSGDTR